LYAAVAAVGVIWALIMRVARPEIYAAIGRGTEGRVTNIPDSMITKALPSRRGCPSSARQSPRRGTDACLPP
jgi:hypothetical protein